MEPILIIGFLVLGTYKMTELFVRRKERLAIIEKLTSIANFESAGPIRLPNILCEKQDFGSWPLRISSLLIGIGIGCLVAFFILVYYNEYNLDWNLRNILIFASISLFGGLGLFIVFVIELNQKNKQSNRDNN
jgi:hypothetical protein